MLFKERFQLIRPLEDMEIALVRAACADPRFINPMEEAVVRTALSLARMYKVRFKGRDVGVGASLAPFREEVTRLLKPVLLSGRSPEREQLLPLVPTLKERTLKTRDELVRRFEHRLPPEEIYRELRHKALVLVSGGGGGTGYVYVGVMAMLDDFGLRPRLLVGTSIGAVLSLFRSRMERFERTEITNIVRSLSWRKLFRAVSTESRYALPAALRLFLRAGIGRYFGSPAANGAGMLLKELPVPTIVTVAGIRRGKLPRPVEWYESLLSFNPLGLLNPADIARKLQTAFTATAELVGNPEVMVKLHLGADPATAEFDALDAAGFSCSVPGVIHYDVLREDVRMRALLDQLFEEQGIFRMIDGGLVDNLPARAAWKAVHKGHIGTRNAFILALNGFCPKLTTPLWLPMQRLAELNVTPNRPYAHLVKDFRKTLSPLELVPSVETLSRAIEMGREQITDDVPFLSRMMSPLPML